MATDTETQQVTVSTLVLAGAHPALVRETPEEVLERLDGDARWVAPAAWAAFTEVGGRPSTSAVGPLSPSERGGGMSPDSGWPRMDEEAVGLLLDLEAKGGRHIGAVLTLRLDADEAGALAHHARRHGVTMTEAARLAIRQTEETSDA